jgi:hypothetical protein
MVPTRYRTRHFFNNFTTNEDIATKFEADLLHCVRNVTTTNVLLFKFHCNIFISVRIIKEMLGSGASGTPCIISIDIYVCFFAMAKHAPPPPSGPGLSHYRGFTITLRHTTLGRTPLDERSARRRDLYLTKHDTHNRQISDCHASLCVI